MTRLYRRKARKAYNSGTTIVVVPCRMYPFGPWGMSIPIRKSDGEETFDQRVRNFEFYNCNYETGYYAAFYLEEKSTGGAV